MKYTIKVEKITSESKVVSIKSVEAKTLKEAWLNNVEAPLPEKRSQIYQGSHRTGQYYYCDLISGTWSDGIFVVVKPE